MQLIQVIRKTVERVKAWTNENFAKKSDITEVDINIVQTTGDSETAVMSQKAVTDAIGEISSCFNSERSGANIVNPTLLQKLGYRYDTADGVTQVENTTCFITAKKIPISGTTHTIIASPEALEMIANGTAVTSSSTPIIFVYYYGENGYISYKVYAFENSPIRQALPDGTTHIHIYSSFENMPNGAICIRQDTITEYEPYQTKKVLKEECLPSVETTDLPAVTEENNGQFLQVVNGAWAAVDVGQAEEVLF